VQAAFLVSANSSGGNLLSSSATHARPRFARRLPAVVAAPVLCGAAAAFVVAGTPATSMAATQAQGKNSTTAVTAKPADATSARLVSAIRPAAKHAAAPVTYTVKSGDTLSTIARHYYQDPDFWPAVYWANTHQIRYANEIQVGQVLTIPAKPAHAPAAPSDLSAPAPAPVHSSSYEEVAPVQHQYQAATEQTVESPVQSTTVSTAGDSSFQQCVISRESGGNPQAMNSSGHYGLYQFSASTWAEYGGNPADFGHASASEQNQVFDNAIAAGGQSNWSAYDGC
jgi:LysM repeat protein